MLPEEWNAVALLLDRGWKGSFGQEEEAAYRILLADFTQAEVIDALKVLLQRGTPFVPAAAEIAQEIRADPSKPSFAEAFRMIYGSGGVLRARAPYRDGRFEFSHDEAAMTRAGEFHPLLAAFIRAYGLRRLRLLPVDHEVYAEKHRQDLRRDWEQFVEANEHREVRELVAPRRGELARFGSPVAEVESG